MNIEFINGGLLSLIDLADSQKPLISEASEDDFRNILKQINITFVATGINRAMSMFLCELSDSYVQQSQRYVNMKTAPIYIPSDTPPRVENIIKKLYEKSVDLYNRMTELK